MINKPVEKDKKGMSTHQYSLRNVFIIAGILFTISFCILSAVSTIYIIKAEKTLDSHSRLENEIYFPLSRAIEEIYSSLADIHTFFTTRNKSFSAQEFQWNMENAMDNLTQAEQAIKHLLTKNTDIITAVSETKHAAVMFKKSGVRALQQTAILYKAMGECDTKINEIGRWARKFLDIINTDTNGPLVRLDSSRRLSIRDLLADIRITYLNICARFYKKTMAFQHIKNGSDDAKLWETLFDRLEKFARFYPELSGRIMFMREELKGLRKEMRTVFDASVAASASIEHANDLANELGINLELCRQAIAETNISIQAETTSLRKAMSISLAGAIFFYILAAFLAVRWIKQNIFVPLDTFNAAIEKIGESEQSVQVQVPALKELSTIASRFNIMANRLQEREQKLKKARQRWEATFRAIGGPAMILSPDYRILEYNDILKDLAREDGSGTPDLKGLRCYEIFGGGDCKCPRNDKEWIDTENIFSLEREIGGRHYLITVSPIRSSDGRIENIVMVGADLSSQKKLEEQLRRAQKMEALGILAGGVAHDLNNILAGIVTYPDIMLMQLSEDSPYRKALLTIRKSGIKATAVVQDLLTLARSGVKNRKVLNVNNIIREYLESPELKKLLNSLAENSKIEIVTRLDDNVMNLEGSPVHLSKTIMNLVTNAMEAMPDGGTITISTANTYLDRPINGYDSVEHGNYVVLSVADNGTGISPHDLPHIFEPFYTRKIMGRSGSGLGMAVVWGTVEDHKGYIEVQSEVGRGTEVIIYLPATHKKRDCSSNSHSISELKGNESILVIDDIEEQREIARYLLETLGYKVDTAANGEEAVAKAAKKRYDLVLLDMIMAPGMDGLETYRQLLEINPAQKAVITSGYSETDRVRKALRLGAGAYIKKPYTIESLGLAIRRELGRQRNH